MKQIDCTTVETLQHFRHIPFNYSVYLMVFRGVISYTIDLHSDHNNLLISSIAINEIYIYILPTIFNYTDEGIV